MQFVHGGYHSCTIAFFYVGYVMLKYAKKVPCRSKVPFWYSKIAERCDDAYE